MHQSKWLHLSTISKGSAKTILLTTFQHQASVSLKHHRSPLDIYYYEKYFSPATTYLEPPPRHLASSTKPRERSSVVHPSALSCRSAEEPSRIRAEQVFECTPPLLVAAGTLPLALAWSSGKMQSPIVIKSLFVSVLRICNNGNRWFLLLSASTHSLPTDCLVEQVTQVVK